MGRHRSRVRAVLAGRAHDMAEGDRDETRLSASVRAGLARFQTTLTAKSARIQLFVTTLEIQGAQS